MTAPPAVLTSLLSIAERVLTVNDIASFDLWKLPSRMTARQARDDLARRGYDVAPLDEEPLLRYVALSDLQGVADDVSVEEVSRPIDAAILVTADLGLSAGIELFRDRSHLFVLQGTHVGGVVTWSDLQKPAVGMVTMALILSAETALNPIIQSVCGDDWPNLLNAKQRKDVDVLYLDRVSHNTQITRLECITLAHRLRIVCSDDRLWKRLGFRSQAEAQTWTSMLVPMRNHLAHGHGLLNVIPTPPAAVARFGEVRDFAKAAWAAAVAD